jgi:hypothetical protein
MPKGKDTGACGIDASSSQNRQSLPDVFLDSNRDMILADTRITKGFRKKSTHPAKIPRIFG